LRKFVIGAIDFAALAIGPFTEEKESNSIAKFFELRPE